MADHGPDQRVPDRLHGQGARRRRRRRGGGRAHQGRHPRRARSARSRARSRRSTSKGRTLMPGLTDAHVHVCAVEGNIAEQHRYNPPSLIVAKALRRIEQALQQGFTTVRDAGGADYGFREAVSSGLYPGPRLLVSGRVLSQTGGHGDKRRRSEWIEPVDCCIGMVGVIADGPDEVRKATREQLRRDVDQIKIMASGGAMSPARRARHDAVHRRGDARRGRGGARGGQVRPRPRLLALGGARRAPGRRALHRARQSDRRGAAPARSRRPAPISCPPW